MLYAERLQKCAFGRAAGGGDNFCAKMVRDLDGGHPDAARARMHEDTLALSHSRDILQGVPGGHENDR